MNLMSKKYIKFSIEVMFIFSIVLFVLSLFVRTVALNKNTYLNLLNQDNTYSLIKETLYGRMDKVLGGNIDENIKESIVTEEDIKKEAENIITGVIGYLQTGENNVQPVDTLVYEERVENVISKIINNFVNPSSDLQFKKTVSVTGKLQLNTMVVTKGKLISGQEYPSVEKLMTASEAQDKIQSILKEKGLTEAQALQKMTEKGITKEQAMKILQSYGIVVDSSANMEGGNNSSLNNGGKSDDNQSKVSESISGILGQGSNSSSESKQPDSNNQGKSFITKLHEDVINSITSNDGKTIKEKLNTVEDKLFNEVKSKMDSEIEKVNINKFIDSSKFQELAKITSVFYKMFWLFMILPIIFALILVKLSDFELSSSLKWIGNGFLISGLIILLIFFSVHYLKFYEDIKFNIEYLKDIISITIGYLLKFILYSGIITSGIGALLLIPMLKDRLMKTISKRKNIRYSMTDTISQ